MSEALMRILWTLLGYQDDLKKIQNSNRIELGMRQKQFRMATSQSGGEKTVYRDLDGNEKSILIDDIQNIDEDKKFIAPDIYLQGHPDSRNLLSNSPFSQEELDQLRGMDYDIKFYKELQLADKEWDHLNYGFDCFVDKGSVDRYGTGLCEEKVLKIVEMQLRIEEKLAVHMDNLIKKMSRSVNDSTKLKDMYDYCAKKRINIGKLSDLKDKIENILKGGRSSSSLSVVGGMVGQSVLSGIIHESITAPEAYGKNYNAMTETGPSVTVIYPDPLAETKEFFAGFLTTVAVMQLAKTAPTAASMMATIGSRLTGVGLVATGVIAGLGYLEQVRQENLKEFSQTQDAMGKTSFATMYDHFYGRDAVYHYAGMDHKVLQTYSEEPDAEKMAIVKNYAIPYSVSHSFTSKNGHELLLTSFPKADDMTPEKTFVVGYWTSGEKEYKALPQVIPVDWNEVRLAGCVMTKRQDLVANLSPEAKYALAVK